MRSRVLDVALATATLIGSAAGAMASPAVTAQSTLGASGLLLDGRGTATTRIVKVAAISFSTDASAGLMLTIASGALTKAGGTPVAFQVVLVARDGAAPSSGAFTTPSGSSYQVSTASASTVERDLYIMYRSAALQDPGAYAATIVLDAIDN